MQDSFACLTFSFNGRVFYSHGASLFESDHGPDRLNLIHSANLREARGQEVHLGLSSRNDADHHS